MKGVANDVHFGLSFFLEMGAYRGLAEVTAKYRHSVRFLDDLAFRDQALKVSSPDSDP